VYPACCPVTKRRSSPKTWFAISVHTNSIPGTYLAQLQGLTLVHFSAQLEPCLTHTKHPTHPLDTGYTTPTRTPYPIKSAQVERRSEGV